MFTSRDFLVLMWNSVDPMDTLREGMLGVRLMFTERSGKPERWLGRA
jgi:hypothetical protein